MNRLFPLFLKLEGRKCLVVGAGKIAESKVASLLDTGATLHVVAPEATGRIKAWERTGALHWHRRKFRNTDLAGCLLVVVATSSRELHERIFRSAKRRNIICNVVDVPDLCDFYYPAVVHRGSLQIAVSTAGKSPAVAQRLRKELQVRFGPEYEEWIAELGVEREGLRLAGIPPAELNAQLHEMATDSSLRKFLKRRRK